MAASREDQPIRPEPGTTTTSPSAGKQIAFTEVLPTPAMTPKPTDTIIITPGYRPGILARTLEMHLDYYYQLCGWGRQFEAVLSQGMGDLLARLDRPVNQVWSAVLTSPAPLPTPTPGPGPGPDQITTPPPTGATPYTTLPAEGKIVGVVYIDGECIGEQGVARLRCFIVDESVRGMGVGRKLLDSAMEFVRHVGFREVRLSTMRSLAAARRLYESYGFVAAGEEWFEEFGNGVWEMKYVWRSTES